VPRVEWVFYALKHYFFHFSYADATAKDFECCFSFGFFFFFPV
jgi:hypothetical protein